eukprot:CAMPEP_0201540132 /NCGR_PEP_ID=MMETSP0161_2-20130828/70781_1 /ASSEMBLY_ACC=CAM_ASM_000251 /TAXON_ID=180227 /ORGANISM="Neoparamoeba aestuarina, Strain SoJaBio B1-5/56/2" /LENGTH=113 /DNA_ID=CAMNT_0047947581 /DNA_START=221 /DNA_END=559 /DNA_ORIENTATION=-
MTTWSSSGLSSYILSLELINPQPDVKFRLKQLTASSLAWTITPLSTNNTNKNKGEKEKEGENVTNGGGEGERGLYEIAPKESTTLFFRVTPLEVTKTRSWENGEWRERGEGEW